MAVRSRRRRGSPKPCGTPRASRGSNSVPLIREIRIHPCSLSPVSWYGRSPDGPDAIQNLWFVVAGEKLRREKRRAYELGPVITRERREEPIGGRVVGCHGRLDEPVPV